MTLSKIAKNANVSVSTVSKVFSDSPEISKETKDTVIKVAKELGCYEKYYKPKYAKKLIAVICPEVLGIHYSQMATYIENDIKKRGGTTVVSVSGFSPETQTELIDYYTNFAHADGIIVIDPISEITTTSEIPIIQIALDNIKSNVHCINIDVSDALDEILTLLKDFGHRKIGFIGEKYTEAEFNIFKRHMDKNGLSLQPKYIAINNERFYDCGYYGMDYFIKNKDIPTVVFSAYSHITLGIFQKLTEENIRVPEDVSVICMDNINCSPYSNIELSCIKMPLSELCAEAVHLLYRIFGKRYNFSKHTITVKREFIRGKTIYNLNEKS